MLCVVVGLPGIKVLPDKDCPMHPASRHLSWQTQQRSRQVKYIYYRQLHTQRTPLPPTHATTTPFSRHTRQSRRPVLTRQGIYRQTDRHTYTYADGRQTTHIVHLSQQHDVAAITQQRATLRFTSTRVACPTAGLGIRRTEKHLQRWVVISSQMAYIIQRIRRRYSQCWQLSYCTNVHSD